MNPQFSDPALLNPFPQTLLFLLGGPHPQGRLPPFPSSDARPLQTLSAAVSRAGALHPLLLSAPSTSVSQLAQPGRAGLMNVGLRLQARPRLALQSPAQASCWPLCPSATRAQGRGVFGSGLNLLGHVRAFPPRLRACACNMCDQHAARSSLPSQTPPWAPLPALGLG